MRNIYFILVLFTLLLCSQGNAASVYSCNALGWPVEGIDATAMGRSGAGAIGFMDPTNHSLINPATAILSNNSGLGISYFVEGRYTVDSNDDDDMLYSSLQKQIDVKADIVFIKPGRVTRMGWCCLLQT